MSDALVSIITPTFNRPEMLGEALKSIFRQTYQNFEVIIVNDGGSGVEQRLEAFYAADKKRITYINKGKNEKLPAARNTALKLARGKYISYLDDDDMYYPNHLETLVKRLETTNCLFAYTDSVFARYQKVYDKYVLSGKDVRYSQDFDHDRILIENFIPPVCVMHEKMLLDNVGTFDESLIIYEDWDLWLRMSRRSWPSHIKEITCEYFWPEDGSSLSSRKAADSHFSLRTIYEKSEQWVSNPNVRAARAAVAQRYHDADPGSIKYAGN